MSLTISRNDGKSLTFDTVITADYEPGVIVTANPIEDGSSATDHAQRLPEQWTATCLLSGAPNAEQAGASVINGIASQGPPRLQGAEDFLRESLGQLVFVTFRDRTRRWFIAGMPYQLNNVAGLTFAITFQEAIIPLQNTTTLPRLRPAKPNLKKKDQGNGDKPKPDPTPTQDAQAKGKVSASILERARTGGTEGLTQSLKSVLGVGGL